MSISRPELAGLLEAVVKRAGQLLGTPHGCIFLVSADESALAFELGVGLFAAPAGDGPPPGASLAAQVWREGRQQVATEDGPVSGAGAGPLGGHDIRSIAAVPLESGRRVAGVLEMAYDAGSARDFGDAELDLINGFAQLASIAIDNARLYAREQRSRELAERLQASARVVNQSLDLNVVLPAILDQLREVMDYDSSSIQLLEGDAMRVIAVRGLPPGELNRVRRLTDHPYNQRLATNAEPIIEGYTPTARLWSASLEPHIAAIRSNMGVPLVVRDRIIGAMTIDSHQPGHYGVADAETAMAFARQAAIAIENARLYGAERAAREQAERLRAATQALSGTMDLQRVFGLILSELQRVVPCDSATVQELRGRRLVVIGGLGFPNLQQILGESFDLDADDNPNRDVVEGRAPVIVDDAPLRYADFLAEPTVKAGIRSWLGVPLLFGDRLIGMLTLDKKEPGFYSREHAGLALSFASQAATAIENARLYTAAQQELAERKRAEADEARLRSELEKAAFEWELTFNAIESPILILDLEGKVLRLNWAAHELALSGGTGAIGGRPLRELGLGQPWQKTSELVEAIGQTHAGSHCQIRDGASGKTWDITVTLFAGLSPGGDRILAVVRDITRMAELQDSLRRSETMSAMGRLVAGAAHEIRNPLFGITATLDACEMRFADQPGFRDYLATLRGQLARMNDLMQELLDYGRPLTADLVPGSLAEAIGEAAVACAGLAKQSNVEMVTQLAPGLPQVRMDRRRVVQVFQNLLQNAIEHSPAGGRVLVEAAEHPEGAQLFVLCAITDSGPGIKPEDLPRIFEPFFTRRRGGTGLGLSIVQRVVEEHGGSVAVENRREGGAAVTVRLPAS